MIITCASVKGGVGKSTVAVNLTVMRTMAGDRVLLIDGDQQGTMSDWVLHRQNQGHPTDWTTISLSGAAIRPEVLKLKDNYDHVIIDAGGRDTQSLRAALSVADIALIPCPPRSFDLWSMEQLASLVQDARCVNPSLQAKAFINMGDSRSSDNEQSQAFINEVDGIDMISVVIGQRKEFSNAVAEGLAVVELKPKQSKAVAELERLTACIFDVAMTTI
jgi:chromosome partitioning protein